MNDETIVKTHAISYIRFSSLEQAKGDSYRRQLERTEKYCKEKELILSKTRYEDLGVSGWTGKNMERGRLGELLAALKAGKIETSKTVLILENFDRFSRLKPRLAYNKLAEIIEAGLDVVTLEDGRVHTKRTIDDFATLISSFAVMQRAHEESTRKSDFTRQNWEQKRKLVIAGKAVLTGQCPAWLRLKADKTGFEPIPERVKLVHRIIRMVKDGKPKREIARMLDAEKVPTWSRAKCWRDNYIYELVTSRMLLGELHLLKRKQPNAEPIKHYYPAVVDELTWLSVQPEKRNFKAGPQGNVNNLFSGLIYDGYHPDFHMKFFMTNAEKNYVYLSSDYATVDPEYLKYNAVKAKGKKPLSRPLSGLTFHYRDFEQHFLKNFGEIDLLEVMPKPTEEEVSRLELLEAENKRNDKALENLVKALESGQPSQVVMAQIEKREATSKRLKKELAAEGLKVKRDQHTLNGFQQEWEQLGEMLNASTREARLALRTLFQRVVQRIDLFMVGLIDVPDSLKTTVFPERSGMMCYSIKLVGGHKIWIWQDGCQVWE
jgi:DNA invertase Pin-like site-specific DNA recombinase